MTLLKLHKAFLFLLFTLGYAIPGVLAQAPANDDCSNAEVINISDGDFGTGSFASSQVNIANATVQNGEPFAPAILVAGMDKKSVWFKFSIATVRAVRVSLSQPGSAIPAGDVGFAVYQPANCLPANADISSKLTPIVTFGNTYHPCVLPGDYLIQVSSKATANGPVSITVDISDQTGAMYDHPEQAYPFGVVSAAAKRVDFDGGCHSIDDATEICTSLSGYKDYYKTTWFTFTTPAYLDYLLVMLSGTTGFFPGGGGRNDYKKFGYKLYRGNAAASPVSILTVIDGCDSLLTNGYHCGVKQYRCDDLEPNTTYSIQLFIHKDFTDVLRLGVVSGGTEPTAAPLPVTGIPPSHALGTLPVSPAGSNAAVQGYFGCNARHSVSACETSVPAGGVTINGRKYNLSSFVTFTLPTTADLNLKPDIAGCGTRPLARLFRHTVTLNCADLKTTDLVGIASFNTTFSCLPPGDYVVQLLGLDSAVALDTITYKTAALNINPCPFTNLGSRYSLTITAYTRKDINNYSLHVPGAADYINAAGGIQQPLQEAVEYTSLPDTFGCRRTLRPQDTTCYAASTKVMYRQLMIADSGTVSFSSLVDPSRAHVSYKLYKGDANALASAQNIFNFPDKISGLTANTECMSGRILCQNKSTCVLPGTYTFTTMDTEEDIGIADQPGFTFTKTRTKHDSPLTAQDMGNIIDSLGPLGPDGDTLMSDIDTWSCVDNAVPVNGYTPCSVFGATASKAIYRQFYLKEAALVSITSEAAGGCTHPAGDATGIMTLFSGKVTDGLEGLTALDSPWRCFNRAENIEHCHPLPTGWYTVISYGIGPNYDDPTHLLYAGSLYNSFVTLTDQFTIKVTPGCPGPQFNRPYRASAAAGNQPHLIEWKPSAASTPAYPETFREYVLPVEHFNCTTDTPFSTHPITVCDSSITKVAYYVFKTTQRCFLQVNTGAGYWGKVFDKDVRADSLQFATIAPIQECNNVQGYIQFCDLRPGTYTLAIFADSTVNCDSIKPSIYIDSVAYSRFDFAKNAYDFGVVRADSVYYFGKPGDINPIDPFRTPGSDFFYCTTGAFNTDPGEAACKALVNDNIYNAGVNYSLYDAGHPASAESIARRNLWYTFVGASAGTIRVKIKSRGRRTDVKPQFAVFSSDVDASLPFNAVQANGLVDSMATQGLNFIIKNWDWDICDDSTAKEEVAFYRGACNGPVRYYIIVDNAYAENGDMLPNTQIDVSVRIDSAHQVRPKFDHYYQADNIGTGMPGIFTGQADNYSCATRDIPDPLFLSSAYCDKTLWYKFSSTISGHVHYRVHIDNKIYSDSSNIQLFKQMIAGDSSINGLQPLVPDTVQLPSGVWAEACVAPGDYYLLLPGCSRTGESAYPEIELISNEGDRCGTAVPVVISGAGAAGSSVKIDCHTIGTDYGEFGPQLTCPQGANTADYKTSWFRMDISGADTLDITTFLVENTNADSRDITYRLMTGDCGAMQEQSCVLDALTQNTYQCFVPGNSYYVQVITPLLKYGEPVTGTIELRTVAAAHTDTCAPLTNCLASANFTSSFDCSEGDAVKFVNYSTYGTAIEYVWDFGSNGQTSAEVSPSFVYPALSHDSTYNVKLIVKNNVCGKTDSFTKTVTVPARPYVNLGNDIIQCDNSMPVVLRANDYPGAAYLWQDGSTKDTFTVSAAGSNNYTVKVTYNGCSSTDTVNVFMSPIAANPPKAITLCPGLTAIGNPRNAGETYLWNTGATTATILVNAPGTYWVDLLYEGCTYRDSFNVSVAGNAFLGNDTTVCFSQNNYVLRPVVDNTAGYTWQNGSVADTFLVTTPGLYYVAVNLSNCIITDSINVYGYPAPSLIVADTAICNGDTLLLPWGQAVHNGGEYTNILFSIKGCDSLVQTVNVVVKPPVPAFAGNDTIALAGQPHQLKATGGVNYAWEPASLLNDPLIANPVAIIHEDSVLFTVTVKDADGCTGYDTVKIKAYNGITYYVPNAFSPNGDGDNDIFRPIPVGIVSTEYFRIFNRYGQLLFETRQWMKGWDGTYKGKPQGAGNYVWIVKGKGLNGRQVEMKGNVVLIR